MTAKDGFVQVSPDVGTGKRIANVTAILPAGTTVLNADGTTSVLTTHTVVYIQKVAITDDEGTPIDRFEDVDIQIQILEELQRIRRGISKISGEALLFSED